MRPSVRHRMRFRDLDKRWIVQSSHGYAIARRRSSLGLAICGVILLISHVVYDDATAAIAVAAVAPSIGWIWFVAPLVRQLRDDD